MKETKRYNKARINKNGINWKIYESGFLILVEKPDFFQKKLETGNNHLNWKKIVRIKDFCIEITYLVHVLDHFFF